MNIVLASDHGGFKMKEYLKKKLVEKKDKYGIKTICDVGTHYEVSCHYPVIFEDFYTKFKNLNDNLKNEKNYGILVCGTGIGMFIP